MNNIIRQPHSGPQTLALTKSDFETLYGGARGGGKTDAGLAWLVRDTENPAYRALVIRKNSEDLTDWVDRARDKYTPLGAVVTGKPATIVFPSGATIRTGHLKDDNAYTKYQGHEYQRMLIEELTQIPSEESYMKLISSCRSTVPGLEARIFCTTNPGGIGHNWVKNRFIDVALPGESYIDPISGRSRVFIPAKVEDNPTLMERDPNYVKYLDSLPEDLRKAWRDGSWDVFDTKGAQYARLINEAREQGRICVVPYEKVLDTYTRWDIGNDGMVIGVFQFFGREIRIIDCIWGQGESFDYYIDILRNKPYVIKEDWLPHDVNVKELTAGGVTRKEYLEKLGRRVKVCEKLGVDDGIERLKLIFNRIWFDLEKTKKLVEALMVYRKKRDDKNQVFLDPVHDWASHFADMMRYMAVTYENQLNLYSNSNAEIITPSGRDMD